VQTKAELRKIYSEKRSLLKPAETELLSREICTRFTALSFGTIRYLHLFYPIPGKKEVDSLLIANWIRGNRPEISLVLSKSNPHDFSLTHLLWETQTPLTMNQWGITEPASGKEIDPEMLDVILIPLLAFDLAGNRVGYGKGFYDRFLTQCRTDALKIGLSFFEAEEEISYLHETDIRLDLCITPRTVYWF
jgi:5-formyltetrahydrofolate cyclo-ligase